jgi:hypothetical protein
MHALAVHAAHPELAAQSSLTLDCTSLSPSATVAVCNVCRTTELCRLSLASLFPHYLQPGSSSKPGELARTKAIAGICGVAREVSLDVETRLHKVAGLWTEVIHALQQSTCLRSLEVMSHTLVWQ